MKFDVKRLPVNDPVIKLTPIMKLTGKLTVSLKIKFTFLFVELFCIPIIKVKNKEELNIKINNIFFIGKNILKFKYYLTKF